MHLMASFNVCTDDRRLVEFKVIDGGERSRARDLERCGQTTA